VSEIKIINIVYIFFYILDQFVWKTKIKEGENPVFKIKKSKSNLKVTSNEKWGTILNKILNKINR